MKRPIRNMYSQYYTLAISIMFYGVQVRGHQTCSQKEVFNGNGNGGGGGGGGGYNQQYQQQQQQHPAQQQGQGGCCGQQAQQHPTQQSYAPQSNSIGNE